jgi:hypothetical protein
MQQHVKQWCSIAHCAPAWQDMQLPLLLLLLALLAVHSKLPAGTLCACCNAW